MSKRQRGCRRRKRALTGDLTIADEPATRGTLPEPLDDGVPAICGRSCSQYHWQAILLPLSSAYDLSSLHFYSSMDDLTSLQFKSSAYDLTSLQFNSSAVDHTLGVVGGRFQFISRQSYIGQSYLERHLDHSDRSSRPFLVCVKHVSSTSQPFLKQIYLFCRGKS